MPIGWEISAGSASEDKYLPVVIDLAWKATVLRPNVLKNWELLADYFSSRGENEEAIAVLTNAASKLPTEPKVHLLLAAACYRARQFDRSRRILNSAPPVPSHDREATILRLELLIKTQSTDEVRLALELLAIDPTNNVAIKAVRKKGPEATIAACRLALERDAGNTRALHDLAVALAMLGRSEEAHRLINLEQFVTVTGLPTPPGYENAKVFEAALASEIDRNPTLLPDPTDSATKGGFQTYNLPRPGDRAISKLLSTIKSVVDAFEAGLDEKLDHPFVAERPKHARLKAWAVVYPGHAYQTAHIHPGGWLSGVYYVGVPESCGDDPNSGHLVLGTVETPQLNIGPPWGIRSIPPIPGQLIMFPSYVPHATIPTHSRAKRICIAFDVMPVRADAKG